MKLRRSALAVLSVLLVVPAVVVAHQLDHAPPTTTVPGPPPAGALQGGEGAKWEIVATIPTGNPQTDVDFFTSGDETFASIGTLGIGANGGGQTIVQLTNGEKVEPKRVADFPSASCVSNPADALSLQHDVEAAPKGDVPLNTANPAADRRDAQVILDATDAPGRCHDQGALSLADVPQGGVEIVDVTDPTKPAAIGLTSHIGEGHTVNVDPKRPHIAYAATSDSVGVNAQGVRNNEAPNSTSFNLDGFEVIDLSSCMDFPAGTTLTQKREACRPQVFRYRYPTTSMALGHTNKGSVYGCHELEVYPDDRLTCGGGGALITLDLKGAFDDKGTPNDFSDDVPRGTPLPCAVRDSSSTGPFRTGAKVTDCVVGEGGVDLRVGKWLASGAPSLEGVKHVGSIHHQGRNATTQVPTTFDATEDIDFNHEAELTHSGRFLLATDERGGGVAPPGASCTPGADNPEGNGGISAYPVSALRTDGPGTADEALSAYAKNSQGGRAIFRVPIRTAPEGSFCTAHIFQQIPGQNRIFMAYYSQGTQVVDYIENADGTIDFKSAAFLIPTNANTWSSAVFKAQENPDGTFTYFGATGDFNLGTAGRSAIDIYKVTLPAPPGSPRRAAGVAPAAGGGDPAAGAPRCAAIAAFSRASVASAGSGLKFDIATAGAGDTRVDIFRQSRGTQTAGNRRVKTFKRDGQFDWSGKGKQVVDGFYSARVKTTAEGSAGLKTLRFPFRRVDGEFRRRPAFNRGDGCGNLRSFRLSASVFGGTTNRALTAAVRLAKAGDATLEVLRGKKVLRTIAVKGLNANRTRKVKIGPRGLPKGDVSVRVKAAGKTSRKLTSRRL